MHAMSDSLVPNIDNNTLVKEYGGLFILIRNGKIIFSNKSSKIVLQYAKKNFNDTNWIIRKIDNGDLNFY